jgi:hypothetical protein
VLGCILRRDISFLEDFFLKKGIYIFVSEHFVEKEFFLVALFQINFGSGTAWIRNDFFRIRILLKVPYPTKSGSSTLQIGIGKLEDHHWLVP